MLRVVVAVLGSLWAVWSPCAPARAYEDQASLDAEVSYAHAVSDDAPSHGVALGLGASLGLDDVLSLRGQLAWALHPSGNSSRSVFLVSAELLYLVDIVELVPYFGVGIDGIGGWVEGESVSTDLGLHPILGVDWLLSREFALGVQLRSIFLLTALDTDPIYFKAGVSASYFLDLF